MRLQLRFLMTFVAIVCNWFATDSCSGFPFRFTNIADTTTAAPSDVFSGFGPPAISGGNVAFRGFYSGGHGIFISGGGPLITVAKLGDAAPENTFTFFADPSFSDGVAAFRGFYGSGQSVFIGNGGALTFVGNSFRDPVISGDRIAIAGPGPDESVLAGPVGSLDVIVQAGDPAPIGTFVFFVYPTISGDTVAFYGAYANEDGEEGEGVFTSSGGPLTTIVTRDNIAVHFGPLAISGNTVAFFNQGTNGIYTGSGGAITKIVEEGDSAFFGALNGFGPPSIRGNTVAFLGVGESESGIFLGSGGPLTPVITTLDSLFGSTVVELYSGSFALDPHGSGNVVAFQYRLSNGRSGIAIASPVPEPTALASLLLAGIGALLLGPVPRRERTRLSARRAIQPGW